VEFWKDLLGIAIDNDFVEKVAAIVSKEWHDVSPIARQVAVNVHPVVLEMKHPVTALRAKVAITLEV
jgi:hypothetical protein